MSNNPHVDDSIEAAGVFRALSDPFRLHIFTSLNRRGQALRASGVTGPMSMPEAVEEIARDMNESPDLVEQHILELTRRRLITVGEDADGRLVITINSELVDRVRRLAMGDEQ